MMSCGLLIVACCLSCTPNQNAAYNEGASEISSINPLTSVGDATSQGHAESPEEETPKWYASVEWANWVLVVVAGLTGWAIWIQARETANATKAMGKSVRLQEAQMRQWLKIGDWQTDTPFPDKNWIRLFCHVSNPTDRLLTIRQVRFWSSYWELPPYDAQWTLAPHDPYPFQIPGLPLAGKLLDDFNHGILEMKIVLMVDFDDALGERETIRFARTCVCGRNRKCESSPDWPGPAQRKETKDN
jgi:hypothetical protein